MNWFWLAVILYVLAAFNEFYWCYHDEDLQDDVPLKEHTLYSAIAAAIWPLGAVISIVGWAIHG